MTLHLASRGRMVRFPVPYTASWGGRWAGYVYGKTRRGPRLTEHVMNFSLSSSRPPPTRSFGKGAKAITEASMVAAVVAFVVVVMVVMVLAYIVQRLLKCGRFYVGR